MIVTGIILLVIGVLAKNGIAWTTGFVVLILGVIALLLGMTGHGIGGRRARPRRAAPARRRGTPSATTGPRFGPPQRGSGRHRSCTLRERRGRQGGGRKGAAGDVGEDLLHDGVGTVLPPGLDRTANR